MNAAPIRNYLPDGGLLLLAGPRLTVLLEQEDEDRLVELWQLVDSGADTDGLLEWLVDTGFRSVPALVCVECGASEEVRVVVRGEPRVQLIGEDDAQQELSGSERRTWLDTSVPRIREVRGGSAVDASAEEPRGLPLRSGAVRASGFHITVEQAEGFTGSLHAAPGTSADPVARAAPAPRADESPATIAAEAESDSAPGLAEVAAAALAAGAAASSMEPAGSGDAPGAATTEDSQPEAAPGLISGPPPPEPHDSPADSPGLPLPPISPPAAPDPAEAVVGLSITRIPLIGEEPEEEPGSATPAAAESPPATPVPQPPTAADPTDLTTGSAELYDQLFGKTRTVSVEGAAVRLAEADEDLPGAPAADQGQPAADPPAAGDHDGRTMTAGQVAQLRKAAGGRATTATPPAAGPGGGVRAALCPDGHPNPPNSEACRSCGTVLDVTELHTIPRPVLGALAFGSGARVALEGTIIMGRSPKPPASMRSEPPRLVALDSPEHGLSRSHVEVRVEGWSVSVVDMGSTNGTEVIVPGEPPQRLRRGEPFLITPGSQVILGGEVSAVYEVEP